MPSILYIGNFSFPLGNAAGKRVYGNSKVLKKLGYNVVCVGLDQRIDETINLKQTQNYYDDIEYYHLSYPKGKQWFAYKKAFNDLIELILDKGLLEDLEMIICYGSLRISLFNSLVISWSKKNNIKVVSDCVDWLSVKTSSIIFDLIKKIDTEYQKRCLNNRMDGIIAISTYLEAYYVKKNKIVIVVPPLSTNITSNNILSTNDKKRFIYAGLPFRKNMILKDPKLLKDRIDKSIIIFSKMKERGFDFVFDIYGFTKSEYLEVLPSQAKYLEILENSINFHGHKQNEEVINELKKSDFSILFRDVKKDTMAGFPTKVSESVSYGIPVITTNTSDLKQYLSEGKNAFFIENELESIQISKMEEIMQINENKVLEMKENCLASKTFFYEKYSSKVSDFLDQVTRKRND